MLTPDQAVVLANRRQRRAVLAAAAFARGLGEPVGFLHRPAAGGVVFEAIALDAARTCATVDERGALEFVVGARPRLAAPLAPPLGARMRNGTRRTAERALVATARPRTGRLTPRLPS